MREDEKNTQELRAMVEFEELSDDLLDDVVGGGALTLASKPISIGRILS